MPVHNPVRDAAEKMPGNGVGERGDFRGGDLLVPLSADQNCFIADLDGTGA